MARAIYAGNNLTTKIDASYVDGGVPVTISDNDDGFIASGSKPVSGDQTIPSVLTTWRTLIGTVLQKKPEQWWNVLSIRHNNGRHTDGPRYGMYFASKLYPAEDPVVTFQKQASGKWGPVWSLVSSGDPEVVISSSAPSNQNARIWVKI